MLHIIYLWGPVQLHKEKGPPMPPDLSNMGACSLRSQCPHAPASHQQSWMPGSALALAKPEARFIQYNTVRTKMTIGFTTNISGVAGGLNNLHGSHATTGCPVHLMSSRDTPRAHPGDRGNRKVPAPGP